MVGQTERLIWVFCVPVGRGVYAAGTSFTLDRDCGAGSSKAGGQASPDSARIGYPRPPFPWSGLAENR
jgi:hypothetical protein